MPLYELPGELLALIGQLTGRTPVLKALRLTCRRFNDLFTPLLFNNVVMRPTENNATILELLNSPYRECVETVILYTHPNPSILWKRSPEGLDQAQLEGSIWDEQPAHFHLALEKLYALPKLNHVDIRFTQECCGDRDPDARVPEQIEYRTQVLEHLLSGLQISKSSTQQLPRVLSLTNLQNKEHGAVTSSEAFLILIRHVKELHISMANEEDSRSGDLDIEFPELNTCFPWLRSRFLAPATQILTRLSLWNCNQWGITPKFVFAGLHFPHLQSLALHKFTIGSNKQLEWVYSHGDTLEALYLENCPIVHRFHVLHPIRDEVGFEHDDESLEQLPSWDETPEDNEYLVQFIYRQRWHHVFDTMRERLNQLQTFAFDENSARRPWLKGHHDFHCRYELGAELYDDRYMMYDDSVWSWHFLSQRVGRDQDGTVYEFISEQEHERDRRAFEELLGVLAERRSANGKLR